MLIRWFAIGCAFWMLLGPANPLHAQPCSIEGLSNCQLFDGSTNRTISDRGVNLAVADDFIPMSGWLSSLCVWGQYIDNDPAAAQADCALDSAPDNFVVQVLRNDGSWPLYSTAQVNAASQRFPVSLNRDTSGTGQVFLFELTLQSSIILGQHPTPGTYWLSVTNNSESATKPHCHWHWSQLSPSSGSGNQFAVEGRDDYFGPVFELASDYAFCTNLDISAGGSGVMQHPCCTCDGNCTITTLAQCNADNGLWDVTEDSCDDVNCPAAGPPANDQCAGMQPLQAGSYLFHNVCANTEGLNPVTTELGPTTIAKDVWFSYLTDSQCFLSFHTCQSNFDTVIAVYHDPNNPEVCPCPTDENLESFLLGAADENCSGGAAVGGGGFVSGQAAGDCGPGCYTIRVGGFDGDSGTILLDVLCGVPGFGQPPIPDPSVSKPRFISMTIPPGIPCGPPGSDQLAVRVRLTSLHHVDPPYTNGVSTPFTAFEGLSRWVGPPSQYVESGANPTPYFASSLQCIPHYRDWSTVPLLHVTGSAIVPSSVYHVETVGGQCEGQENIPECQSGGSSVSSPVEIKTARWADVEVPHNPPSPTGQPDMGDVGMLVGIKWHGSAQPPKAQCLLVGNDPFGNFSIATLAQDMNFSHVAACVDAFRGAPYPFQMGECPFGRCRSNPTDECVVNADCPGTTGPCTYACTTTADCQTGGPCTLYCP